MRKFSEKGRWHLERPEVLELSSRRGAVARGPTATSLRPFEAKPGAIRRCRCWLPLPSFFLQGAASDLRHGIHLVQPPGITVLSPPGEPEPRGGAGLGLETGEEEGGSGRAPGAGQRRAAPRPSRRWEGRTLSARSGVSQAHPSV